MKHSIGSLGIIDKRILLGSVDKVVVLCLLSVNKWFLAHCAVPRKKRSCVAGNFCGMRVVA